MNSGTFSIITCAIAAYCIYQKWKNYSTQLKESRDMISSMEEELQYYQILVNQYNEDTRVAQNAQALATPTIVRHEYTIHTVVRHFHDASRPKRAQ
jgi:hypothetical protein